MIIDYLCLTYFLNLSVIVISSHSCLGLSSAFLDHDQLSVHKNTGYKVPSDFLGDFSKDFHIAEIIERLLLVEYHIAIKT